MNPPPTEQQRLAERTRPPGPVVAYQRWEQLLFLHWRWDADTVQRTLPRGLTVDVFQGSAWLGIVPIFMRGVRPKFAPAVSMVSDFLELNVRTYVYDALGRPGIYFHSLDCDQPLAVETAKRLLDLRYEHATMSASVDADGVVEFDAQRRGAREKARLRYQPLSTSVAEAAPESLEYFLVERYRLFSSDGSGEQLKSIRVCHAPYRLKGALAFEWTDLPLRWDGFAAAGRAPDHVCAAEPVDVEVFAPEKVD